MTEHSYPVDLSIDAARAACAAYDAVALLGDDAPGPAFALADPRTHHEAYAVRAALPHVLRDELARLVRDAFGDDYDGSDYHYALESLRDGVVSRLEELERYLETT